MSKIDVTDSSMTALIDDCAMNAMAALITCYSPQEWPKEYKDVNKWCDFIATHSYYMAAAMMDARSTFHNVLIDCKTGEEQDAA
jgi:hypothetical protein